MPKTMMRSLVAVAALAASAAVLAADPSPDQIYNAVKSGQLVQAQQMVEQVLKDHPDSAKAHYIAAEVDAKIGDLNAARQELAKSRDLDPKLAFASAHSVNELTAQLNGRTLAPGLSPGLAPGGLAPRAALVEQKKPVPWGAIILIGAIVLLAWNFFRRRQQQNAYLQSQFGGPQAGAAGQPYGGPIPGGPGQPGYAPGYGPGYGAPYPPPQGGLGSGIMGGVASGLAVGAGVAAGEALVDHFVHGGSEHAGGGGFIPAAGASELPQNPNQDLGGNDFGLTGSNDDWGDSSGGDWSSGGGGGDDWT